MESVKRGGNSSGRVFGNERGKNKELSQGWRVPVTEVGESILCCARGKDSGQQPLSFLTYADQEEVETLFTIIVSNIHSNDDGLVINLRTVRWCSEHCSFITNVINLENNRDVHTIMHNCSTTQLTSVITKTICTAPPR